MQSTNFWIAFTFLSIAFCILNRKNSIFIFTFTAFFTGASVFNFVEFGIQPIHILLTSLMILLSFSSILNNRIVLSIQFFLLQFFYLFGLNQISNSLNNIGIGQYIYPLICIFCFYMAFYHTKTINYSSLLKFLTNMSIFMILFGFFDNIMKILLVGNLNQYINNNISADVSLGDYTLGILRMQSIFTESSYYGAFSAIVFLIFLGPAIKNRNIHYKITLIVTFLAVISSFSLVGIITLLFGTIIFFWIYFVQKIVTKSISIYSVLITMGGLLTVILLLLFGDSGTGSFFRWVISRLNLEDTSSMLRIEALTNGYAILFEKPFGIGFGNFSSFDLFSTAAATTGILGFTVLIVTFLIPLLRVGRGIFHTKNTTKISIFMGIFGILFALGTGIGQYSVVWTWVLLGILSRFAMREAYPQNAMIENLR